MSGAEVREGQLLSRAHVSEARRHSVKWKCNPFSVDEMTFLCLQSITNLRVSVLLGSIEASYIHGMMNFEGVRAIDWNLWIQTLVPSFLLLLSVINKCFQGTFPGWLQRAQHRYRWFCPSSIWCIAGPQNKCWINQYMNKLVYKLKQVDLFLTLTQLSEVCSL